MSAPGGSPMGTRAGSASAAARVAQPGGPRSLLAAFALAGLAFVLWPQIDLAVSGWFARGSAGFPLQADPLLGQLNKVLLQVLRAGNWLLLALALLAWARRPRNPLRRWRRQLAFLALAAALGPGVLVNVLVKDHFGRARPVASAPFGGEHRFSPAFMLSDQCDVNCSFVSGHAAGATMPAAGYFIAAGRRRRRLWLAAGLTFGAAVGLLRIAVGAHYLSDVVMGIGFTWAAAVVCALLLLPGPMAAPRAAPYPGHRGHAGQ